MQRLYKYLSAHLQNIEPLKSPDDWYDHISINLRNCRDCALKIPLCMVAKLLVVPTMVLALVVAYYQWGQLEAVRENMHASPWGVAFLTISSIFMVLSFLYFTWQVICFIRYRPAPAVTDAKLPTCTVVVPAYNEGQQVLVTLRSLVASDFPPGKLQIISVDDGSRDDTWYWMCEAKKELGERLEICQLPKNQGKRHALHEGFRHATGEILVTADSDSIVEPCTLRNLLAPFVNNPQCGAVAGNVRVLNRHEGMIPRMLDVSFVYSFDFVRSAQSVVRSVLCTPGALAAYRRGPVMNVLPEWLNQMFLGKKSDIGEDRAMTNLILRQGYSILFQTNAVVYTNVPTRYRGLCNMFIRWARSNVRENIGMSCFAFRAFRDFSASGARAHLSMLWFRMIGGPIFLLATVICLFWQPELFFVNILAGLAVMSTVPAIFYAWRHRVDEAAWAYAYGIFNLAALSWIGPYSLFTVHKSGWLTRQHPASATPPTTTLVPSLQPIPISVNAGKTAKLPRTPVCRN